MARNHGMTGTVLLASAVIAGGVSACAPHNSHNLVRANRATEQTGNDASLLMRSQAIGHLVDRMIAVEDGINKMGHTQRAGYSAVGNNVSLILNNSGVVTKVNASFQNATLPNTITNFEVAQFTSGALTSDTAFSLARNGSTTTWNANTLDIHNGISETTSIVGASFTENSVQPTSTDPTLADSAFELLVSGAEDDITLS